MSILQIWVKEDGTLATQEEAQERRRQLNERQRSRWQAHNWVGVHDNHSDHHAKFYWCRRQDWVVGEDFDFTSHDGNKVWGFKTEAQATLFLLRWI